MKYADWRVQLQGLQTMIDLYDEENDGNESVTREQYWNGRRPLTEKLEAHYALESTTED